MSQDYFPDCIGQNSVKRRLSFYMEGFRHSGVCPNLMFLSQKGSGKSMLARQMGEVLETLCKERGGLEKPFYEIACGGIKKGQELIRRLMGIISAGHCTIFLDEFHALPPDAANWLLTAIEQGRAANIVSFGGREAVWDFSKVTLIVATTERQSVFVPLLNRFREITLEGYMPDELSAIMMSRVTVPVAYEALDWLVTLARGNARSIVDLAAEINCYAAQRVIGDYFSIEMARELVEILDIQPLGVSRAELNLLIALSKVEEYSLKGFCAVSGLTRAAQQDMELYLMRHGLMEINDKSRRVITSKGSKYLRELNLQNTQVAGAPVALNP